MNKIISDSNTICVVCHEDFIKNKQKGNFPCDCTSPFHIDCLLHICLKVSPDLDPFQLKNFQCLKCQKNISYTDLEAALGEVFANEKKKKVRCHLCKNEEKFDQMYERMCGHNFCPKCFKNYLEGIIKRKKGNIRDYVCPIEKCKLPRIEFSELKQYIMKELLNYYDDYLEKIYDSEKNHHLIFKCKTDDCYKIKVTPLFYFNEKEYICWDCEFNQKED